MKAKIEYAVNSEIVKGFCDVYEGISEKEGLGFYTTVQKEDGGEACITIYFKDEHELDEFVEYLQSLKKSKQQ